MEVDQVSASYYKLHSVHSLQVKLFVLIQHVKGWSSNGAAGGESAPWVVYMQTLFAFLCIGDGWWF